METVLLYQIKGTKTAALLKPVLLKLGIRVRIVEPEQYLQSIGFLAGNKAFAESPEAYDGAGFEEPMMVMAGFSERKLDLFLTEMRRKKVPPIALKAIVTTQNQAWNSLQLYRELKNPELELFLHATTPYNRVQSRNESSRYQRSELL